MRAWRQLVDHVIDNEFIQPSLNNVDSLEKLPKPFEIRQHKLFELVCESIS
jgi:hypothetical protein